MKWADVIISLLDGFLGVFFAGVFIWLFQYHYTEKSKRSYIYVNRIQKVEDEFYKEIKSSRNGFYSLCFALTNNGNLTQEDINHIVQGIQQAFDYTECNPLILGKYKKAVYEVFSNYNDLSNTWNAAKHFVDRSKSYEIYNQKLMCAKDRIFLAYNEIDRIYFNLKR